MVIVMKKLLDVGKNLSSDTIFIVVANLTTLFGVIFLNWNLFSVLFLYWLESAIIGFYNIFKMVLSPTFPKDFQVLKNYGNGQIIFLKILLKIIFIPFFIMHYGLFMLGHLFFIYFVSFSSYIFEHGGSFPNETGLSFGIFIPISMLFLSHGFSFLKNFFVKKEYLKTSVMALMATPYQRIVLMHLTLLFGGIFSMIVAAIMQSLNTEASLKLVLTSIVISLFVILKIFVDINAHLKEHSPLSSSQ